MCIEQGYAPGIFGVSHGVLQFAAYEECKKAYCKFRNQPIDKHLVSTDLFDNKR